MPYHLFHFFHGWAGIITFLLFAAIIIYFIFRRTRLSHSAIDRRDSLEILKKRLASGDISIEEFNKLKKILYS